MRRPARAAKSVSPRQKEAGGGGGGWQRRGSVLTVCHSHVRVLRSGQHLQLQGFLAGAGELQPCRQLLPGEEQLHAAPQQLLSVRRRSGHDPRRPPPPTAAAARRVAPACLLPARGKAAAEEGDPPRRLRQQTTSTVQALPEASAPQPACLPPAFKLLGHLTAPEPVNWGGGAGGQRHLPAAAAPPRGSRGGRDTLPPPPPLLLRRWRWRRPWRRLGRAAAPAEGGSGWRGPRVPEAAGEEGPRARAAGQVSRWPRGWKSVAGMEGEGSLNRWQFWLFPPRRFPPLLYFRRT